MIYYENEYLTITYEPEHRLAYTQWHQFAPSEEYRQALNKYLDLVRDYPVTRWIGNTTHSRVIRPQDQDWTTTDWLPRFMHSGVKRMAIILPEDIFARMSIDSLLLKAGDKVPFDTHYFQDEASARAWVMELG